MGGPGNSDVDNEPRDVRGTQDSDDQRGAEMSQDPRLLKTLWKQDLVPGLRAGYLGFVPPYPSPL